MTYKSIFITARGGPEVLQAVDMELRPPVAGEARVRILAVAVCQDDVAARVGNRPFPPQPPFVPGYTMVGVVDAVGPALPAAGGAARVAVGDRVAALTVVGSYAEYIYVHAAKVVPVPATLDPAEVAPLILNYLVAYQALHRSVQVKPGDKALIIGASGGVGTAFLDLGRLAGLKMYGLASAAKHQAVAAYGAIPIDYHTRDFAEVIRQAEPDGLDYVFNGMSGEYLDRGLAVLRCGGTLVHYGAPQSLSGLLSFVGKFTLLNLWPDGKAMKGYGTHSVDIELLKEDWKALFALLEEGKIKPVIARKFPVLEAAKANALLESGQVFGAIVLVAPELLPIPT